MSLAETVDNRVKPLRQARGWSQAELAEAAGLSRTGVSAIEGQRLVPSVAAALALGKALGCTVEELFGGSRADSRPLRFAWPPVAFPCRYWGAEVAGQTWLYPVECGPRGGLGHDGRLEHAAALPAALERASETLVLASCDPAAALLAALYRRRSGLRMLVLTRSSGEALDLLQQGLVHVAGVHLAASDQQRGNLAAVRQRFPGDAALLRVAVWEEGLAFQPAARLKTAGGAARAKLRWIGRNAGAGARRCQDELLGRRPAPRHVARDHRGVVEAIRSGWADVGVCVRLASEEGQLQFLPVATEPYDLCYGRDSADDPRLAALVRVVRSREYRQLLSELPGYQLHNTGDIEEVRGE
ncbi:MAG: substrate-binding domain-containing protein [Pirellulaceae bacterium]|nr:substrate-binding domain-containing protein [Pirellulaceae bacterium]